MKAEPKNTIVRSTVVDITVQSTRTNSHQEALPMKRNLLIAMMFVATAGFAVAQNNAYSPSTDVLGAHLNYGRGCPACHTPHSGALGNGIQPAKGTDTGSFALWGEDASPLYGATITFAGGTETLPTGIASGSAEVKGILLCLSCHDGNLATGAMMKNKTYEALPAAYGTNSTAPTLLGNNGVSGQGAASYLTDHPVGATTTIGCNGGYNWDCTVSATGSIQPGPNMAKFINNYGFFVKPAAINNAPAVMCTTCHNQHIMNVVSVTNKPFSYTTGAVAVSGTQTGLATGYYKTMFFVLAPYDPTSTTAGSNQTTQFCRQCHGGESNEMNNGSAGTTF
jgi:cytochrome c553